MLKTARATTISALYQIVRRRRIESVTSSTLRSDELIARAAARPDEGGLPAIDLAPQPLNVDLDHVRARIVAAVPHVFGQFLTRNHGAFLPTQVFEQRVLTRRQVEPLAIGPGFTGAGVEGDPAALEAFRQNRQHPAALQGTQAGVEFTEVEWLGQIVVGAGIESCNP